MLSLPSPLHRDSRSGGGLDSKAVGGPNRPSLNTRQGDRTLRKRRRGDRLVAPTHIEPSPWMLRAGYLSASPITGSIEPMIATTSDTIEPSQSGPSICRLQNEGERIFIRHACPVPSLTM